MVVYRRMTLAGLGAVAEYTQGLLVRESINGGQWYIVSGEYPLEVDLQIFPGMEELL